VAPVPRLALTVEEACAALGVGEDFFREQIAPELAIVRRGRRKLVAVAALEDWLAANGERILENLATGNGSPSASESDRFAGTPEPRASRAPARRAA
jgi:excisionase family DNA binding protein